MLLGLRSSIKDIRDRALLLLGFAGAFRRSELAAIDFDALKQDSTKLIVMLSKTKTDQEGRGRTVIVDRTEGPSCPYGVLEEWLKTAGIDRGPIFRRLTAGGRVLPSRLSPEAVAVTIKQRVKKAVGLAPQNYSGHSLRAGFVTTAARKHVPGWAIRYQTGHSSDAMLDPYIRG